MNTLDKLRRRHDLLTTAPSELPALQVAQAFTAAARPLRQAELLSDGLSAAIELDLVYAVLRLRHWTVAPLFAEVLTDFLAVEHRLERPVAAALVRGVMPAARRLAPESPTHVPATDAEFLRYVCVATATATCEEELVMDLGIGRGLLARIKDAVRLVARGDEPDRSTATQSATAHFVPELDAQIANIVTELGRDLRTTPWSLHVQRLRFHLIGIGAPWSALLEERGARWLFDLLLALAARGTSSSRQLATRLGKLLPDLPEAATPDFAQKLLTDLGPFNLAHPEGAAAWRALPLAEELTAEAFARNLLNTPKDPWEELTGLCGPYQAGVLRSLEQVDEAHLLSLMLGAKPLPPAALAAAIGRLVEAAGTAAAAAGVSRLLQGAVSPWVKQAACDALAACATPLPIAQLLGDMAVSDPSLAVRAAALRATLRHGLDVPKGEHGA